ncbi:hypothetical protein DMH27_14525 [Raoultella planticola]|nr:hypothetical protein [Raoultella planticola]
MQGLFGQCWVLSTCANNHDCFFFSLYRFYVRVESAVSLSLWQQCLARLQDELPATEFSMWIRPLQAELSDNTLALYAPNRFVLDWVRDKYLNNINGLSMILRC